MGDNTLEARVFFIVRYCTKKIDAARAEGIIQAVKNALIANPYNHILGKAWHLLQEHKSPEPLTHKAGAQSARKKSGHAAFIHKWRGGGHVRGKISCHSCH